MPELSVNGRTWAVTAGANLLDALRAGSVVVPSSCRAGHCQSCRVRCISGQPVDLQPQALATEERAEGWRLACQCQVVEPLVVAPYDPAVDGVPARVSELTWLSPGVLRLRVQPQRPLRYQPGQHVVLWSPNGVARPYSLASQPNAVPWLEFHVQCARPGAFVNVARQLRVGDPLVLGKVAGGALYYDPAWAARPLWLLASGTGLAPLWAILHQALAAGHEGSIRVVHSAQADEHYLADALEHVVKAYPALQVDLCAPGAALASSPMSRSTMALACGSPTAVAAFARQLFMAGVPRGQVLTEAFETGPVPGA